MEVAQQLFIWFHSEYTMKKIYNNSAFRDKLQTCINVDGKKIGGEPHLRVDGKAIFWLYVIPNERVKDLMLQRYKEINTCLECIDPKNQIPWKVKYEVKDDTYISIWFEDEEWDEK